AAEGTTTPPAGQTGTPAGPSTGGGLISTLTGAGSMTGASGTTGARPATTSGALSGPFSNLPTTGPAPSAGGPATPATGSGALAPFGNTGSLGDASGRTATVGGTAGAITSISASPSRSTVNPLAGGTLLSGGLSGGGVLNADVLN